MRPVSKSNLAPYVENVGESALSCLLTMVQGNVLALTLSHWLVASQTGLLAGAIVGTTVIVGKPRRAWVVSLLLGVSTAAADAVVHGAGRGLASLAEHAITGVGAAALSFAVGGAVRSARSQL